MEDEHVVLMHGQPFLRRQGKEVFGILQGRRKRLLDQNVFSGAKRFLGPAVVEPGRKREIDGIDVVRLDERPVSFIDAAAGHVDEGLGLAPFVLQDLLGRSLGFFPGRDGHAGEFEAAGFLQRGEETPDGDFGRTDDADSHVKHI